MTPTLCAVVFAVYFASYRFPRLRQTLIRVFPGRILQIFSSEKTTRDQKKLIMFVAKERRFAMFAVDKRGFLAAQHE
jgi:hypothetical protein